jgi:hypothetical protein
LDEVPRRLEGDERCKARRARFAPTAVMAGFRLPGGCDCLGDSRLGRSCLERNGPPGKSARLLVPHLASRLQFAGLVLRRLTIAGRENTMKRALLLTLSSALLLIGVPWLMVQLQRLAA